MKHHFLILFIVYYFVPSLLISCEATDKLYTITTVNNTNLKREKETIEIQLKDVPEFSKEEYNNLSIFDTKNNLVISQLVDIDQDSIQDYIIFQTDFNPNETKKFTLVYQKETQLNNKVDVHTFCRIVPERIDDFAWENDKVAFRTYGPKCQQLFEEGKPGGLISSGIDCWTKRVDYPIINKWYKDYLNGKSYHKDHGEGYDAYHVGTTRGCGGVALIHNNTYVLTKNFTNWKILANGPIRSIFELEYATIKVGNSEVSEKKRISLDLGTHLYHCQISYTSKRQLSKAGIGLALHQGKGKTTMNKAEGWVSYWEPMEDSYIGTAILINPKSITNIAINDTLSKDESFNNLWVNTKIQKNHFSYWAGFGWKKSGDFNTSRDWENYLKKEASKKNTPIAITLTKK
ncbi:DUF4861 family protein [Aquimarina algiphila]|uniref:DUF4861 family protein n=1 Tax=Aquimarina algiphila TaxID=2047982 RepID=UPI002493A223|nr:DUF4861 family protein [Aquimarina algiphila]